MPPANEKAESTGCADSLVSKSRVPGEGPRGAASEVFSFQIEGDATQTDSLGAEITQTRNDLDHAGIPIMPAHGVPVCKRAALHDAADDQRRMFIHIEFRRVHIPEETAKQAERRGLRVVGDHGRG